jgi:hypothetical protein
MFSSLVSGLRNRGRKRIQKKTEEMDPAKRSQLVEDVQGNLSGLGSTAAVYYQEEEPRLQNDGEEQDSVYLVQLESELETAKENLENLQEKERFIKTRLEKYERALPQLPDEQQEQYRQQLVLVAKTHQDMLENIKKLKGRIRELEIKQAELHFKLNECHDFLEAAAAVDQLQLTQEEAGEDDTLEEEDGEDEKDGLDEDSEAEDEENEGEADSKRDEEKEGVEDEEMGFVKAPSDEATPETAQSKTEGADTITSTLDSTDPNAESSSLDKDDDEQGHM